MRRGVGILLIGIGALFLFGLLVDVGALVPLLLIGGGLYLLYTRREAGSAPPPPTTSRTSGQASRAAARSSEPTRRQPGDGLSGEGAGGSDGPTT
jgi:threonine/homoserine/homoserine lactone efflux protein